MFDTNVNKACAELICVLIDKLTDNHWSGVRILNGGWAVGYNNEDKPRRLHSPADSFGMYSVSVTVLPRQAVVWYAGHLVGFVSLDLKKPAAGPQLLLAGDLVAALERSIQTVVEEGHAE